MTPTGPEKQTPVLYHSKLKPFHFVFGFICLLVLIASAGSVYYWQHQKVLALSNQVATMQSDEVKSSAISLNNLKARLALPNIVIDNASSPTDLIAFLGSTNTQCYEHYDSGYYKIVATTADTYAKMQYGCTAKNSTTLLGNSPAYILAKKVNNAWSLISPTNQWLPFNEVQVPSCTMVNGYSISKLVTPECWTGPALNSKPSIADSVGRSVIQVTNQ